MLEVYTRCLLDLEALLIGTRCRRSWREIPEGEVKNGFVPYYMHFLRYQSIIVLAVAAVADERSSRLRRGALSACTWGSTNTLQGSQS